MRQHLVWSAFFILFFAIIWQIAVKCLLYKFWKPNSISVELLVKKSDWNDLNSIWTSSQIGRQINRPYWVLMSNSTTHVDRCIWPTFSARSKLKELLNSLSVSNSIDFLNFNMIFYYFWRIILFLAKYTYFSSTFSHNFPSLTQYSFFLDYDF